MIAATTRDLLHIEGGDAATYLQGQVANDVEALEVGGSCWTLVLHPQGKVAAWGRVTRLADDRFVFDTQAGAGAAARARLERFRLRVDVHFDLEEGVPTLAVRDVTLPDASARLVVPAGWPDHDGVDLIDPRGGATADADEEELERLRIEAGVPAVGAELDESTIPAEAGPWLIESSVDFDKGCYVGQELVARVDSRGANTPRRVRRLRLPPSARPGVGATVQVAATDVGRVTSAVAGLALASLGRGVEVPANVEVVDGASTWSARAEAL